MVERKRNNPSPRAEEPRVGFFKAKYNKIKKAIKGGGGPRDPAVAAQHSPVSIYPAP